MIHPRYYTGVLVHYTPPTHAQQADRQPATGWISCGWVELDKWRVSHGQTMGQLAVALGVSPQLVSAWKTGVRHPTPPQRATIEHASAVPPAAWLHWVLGDGVEADAPTPPDSEKRSLAVEPAKLGSTREELEDIAARCKALARSPGLTPKDQAWLEGQRRSAMSELRRLDESAALEDHPDFDLFLDDASTALEATLAHYGINPNGARTIFGKALVAAESARKRRAA